MEQYLCRVLIGVAKRGKPRSTRPSVQRRPNRSRSPFEGSSPFPSPPPRFELQRVSLIRLSSQMYRSPTDILSSRGTAATMWDKVTDSVGQSILAN